MILHSVQDMLDFGHQFAKNCPNVIELIGDVGAGKTTFVRGLAKGLGITQPITSPSFTISKSYALPNNQGNLIHYDFYRLSDPGLMSADLSENLSNPNNIIIVEWAESVSDLLPPNRTTIFIEKSDMDSREIVVKNNQGDHFRDILQPTGSELAKNPVTTTIRAERTKSSLSVSKQHQTDNLESTGTTKHVKKGVTRLFLDTSTPTTILRINDKEYTHDFGHDLAEKLLSWLHDKLTENHKSWQDISEIIFMSGPGSFTGLRIGASIVNALSHELDIPLKDHHGNQHSIIIPEYGRPARITAPRK